MQLPLAVLSVEQALIEKYERQLREMEDAHQRDKDEAVRRNEAKMNKKIDLLERYYLEKMSGPQDIPDPNSQTQTAVLNGEQAFDDSSFLSKVCFVAPYS